MSTIDLAVVAFASEVSGLGVKVPVLGDTAPRLIGPSSPPVGDTGLLLICDEGMNCCVGGTIGDRPENGVGEGFHDERWKLFFFRTLALYAARIAAVASFVMLKTLPDDAEGAVETTLGARECGCARGECGCVREARLDSSNRDGRVALVGEVGTGVGWRMGENAGEGNEDSQLSY